MKPNLGGHASKVPSKDCGNITDIFSFADKTSDSNSHDDNRAIESYPELGMITTAKKD